jgi:hypothetical protein
MHRLNDSILLFNIADKTQPYVTNYTVDSIKLNDYTVIRLIEKQCRMDVGEGTVISSVCMGENCFYTFENVSKDGKTDYQVIKYDITGEQMNVFELNLDHFLKLPGAEDDGYDTVFDIYKFDNFIILLTLNRRDIVFQEQDGILSEYEIPSELYDESRNLYSPITPEIDQNKTLYFFDQFSDTKNLIAFDKERNQFEYIDMPFIKDGFRRFFRNEEGDIFIQQITFRTPDHPAEKGGDAVDYIYMKYDDLIFQKY